MSAELLCTACGMCCDGTLFGHVRLAPDDVAAAADAGLAVVPVKGGSGFLQPCPQLGCDGCAIYTRRPEPCRRFRCTTLLALVAQEIDAETADRRVDAAKRAIARLSESDTRERSPAAMHDQLRLAGQSPNPAQLVALAALELLLDRYFRRPDQRVLAPDQAATAASP